MDGGTNQKSLRPYPIENEGDEVFQGESVKTLLDLLKEHQDVLNK